MKSLPIYILVILLIAILVFKCDNEPSKTTYEPYEVLYEVHDTTIQYVNVYHESLRVDTIIRTDFDTIINDYNYTLSEYHYKINDSILDGTIVALSPFKPIIDFKYKVKSFVIRDSIVLRENNYRGFLYGGELTVDPIMSQLEFNIAYQFKRGDIFKVGVGYDFNNNNKLITVGFLKRF